MTPAVNKQEFLEAIADYINYETEEENIDLYDVAMIFNNVFRRDEE